MGNFNPWGDGTKPCWHCAGFDGLVTGGALCSMPGCCRLRALPQNGCSRFVREPGADDEPGPPPLLNDRQHRQRQTYRAA